MESRTDGNGAKEAAPIRVQISLVELANTLLRHGRVVVVVPLVMALVVGVWSLSQRRSYVVEATFMPQGAGSSSGGSMAALAQQFGVSVGTSGQSPQFYVDLLRSQTVLRKAVESEYRVENGGDSARTATLIQLYDLDPARPVPLWRQAMDRLSKDMSASLLGGTGLVRLRVTAARPALAEQVAQRLLAILNEFNLEVRRNRAIEEGRFIGERLTDARTRLLMAEDSLQDFLQQNRDFANSPELLFEHDRLQRQVNMRQEIYTSLLRSEEQARIDGVRDTPVLTIIDDPAGAARIKGRGTVLRAALAFLLGVFVSVLTAFLSELVRRNRQAGSPEFAEFEALVRQAWTDIRRPVRWLTGGRAPAEARDR